MDSVVSTWCSIAEFTFERCRQHSLSEPREGFGILQQLIKSTVSRELSYFSHEFLVKYAVA